MPKPENPVLKRINTQKNTITRDNRLKLEMREVKLTGSIKTKKPVIVKGE